MGRSPIIFREPEFTLSEMQAMWERFALGDPVVEQHRQVLQEKADAAKARIAEEWRRRGRDSLFGALGAPLGDAGYNGGEFEQAFEYGKIRTSDWKAPRPQTAYLADVYVAAIRCFGTDDPGGLFDGGDGEDEPYLILTATIPGDAFLGGDSRTIVRTWRSRTFTGIKSPAVFCQEVLAFQDLPIGPYGLGLKILLMDHEHGSEEQLEKEIREKGNALAQEFLTAAEQFAGLPADEAVNDQVLDSTLLRILGDLSVDLITNILKDDKLGEKDWRADGEMLKRWVDEGTSEASIISYPGILPASVNANFPRDDGPHLLFSGGGGSYKVYLHIVPKRQITDWGSPQD